MKQTLNQGFISIKRKAFDVRIPDAKTVKNFEDAWIRLLTLVNFRDGKVRLGKTELTCREGESIRQLKSWAASFGWSRYRTRIFFAKLTEMHLVQTNCYKGHFMVRVVNYHEWVPKRTVETKVDEETMKRAFEIFWSEYERITGIPKADRTTTFAEWRVLTEEEMNLAIQNIQPYFEAVYEAQRNYKKSARYFLKERSFVLN